MASKTKMTDFSVAVKEILDQYADELLSGSEDAIKAVAKTGVAELRRKSPRSSGAPSFGQKHYANQWAVRDEITRLTAGAIIYNKAPTYRLAHLLENGHAKRGGGRTAAIPHIKPVEREIIDDIERRIKALV